MSSESQRAMPCFSASVGQRRQRSDTPPEDILDLQGCKRTGPPSLFPGQAHLISIRDARDTAPKHRLPVEGGAAATGRRRHEAPPRTQRLTSEWTCCH